MTIASYRDPALPVAARVNDLLGRTTLDEKAALAFQQAIVALSDPFPVNIRVRAKIAGDTISGSAKPSMFVTPLPLAGQRSSSCPTRATSR